MYNEREHHKQQIRKAERACKIARLQGIGLHILTTLPFILFCVACYLISPFNR